MDKFRGQMIAVDEEGNEIPVYWTLKPTKDTVTSDSTAWSSGKIQIELDKKANNASVNALQSRYNSAVYKQTSKANKSDLATQVVFTLSGNDLRITTK